RPDVLDGRALQVAVDLEPLEQPARVAELFEFLAGDEVVIDALVLVTARRTAPIVPFPAPEVPARTRRTPRRLGPGRTSPDGGSASAGKLLEQRPPLVRTQPAQTAALGDLELRHDVAGPNLADTRKRLEDTHDLQLGEHVARLVTAVGGVEKLAQRERTDLEFVLHLGSLTARDRRLLERELTLLRCERGRVRHVIPPARRRDAMVRFERQEASRISSGAA